MDGKQCLLHILSPFVLESPSTAPFAACCAQLLSSILWAQHGVKHITKTNVHQFFGQDYYGGGLRGFQIINPKFDPDSYQTLCPRPQYGADRKFGFRFVPVYFFFSGLSKQNGKLLILVSTTQCSHLPHLPIFAFFPMNFTSTLARW